MAAAARAIAIAIAGPGNIYMCGFDLGLRVCSLLAAPSFPACGVSRWLKNKCSFLGI